jgi:hypothetical protein
MTTETKTFLERQAATERLWQFVLPTVALPSNLQWVRWLSTATDKEIERCILQIPYVYQKRGLPADEEVYRFISSTLSTWRHRRLSKQGENV